MPRSLHEFGQEMAQIMPRFMTEASKKMHCASAAEEVTIPQMVILNILKEKARCKMKEIAETLSITTSAATGIIDRMVRSNLLKRISDEKDRRVINIEMTRKGEKLIDDIQKRRYKLMMGIFGRLTAAEREGYLRIIKKIYGILKEKDR